MQDPEQETFQLLQDESKGALPPRAKARGKVRATKRFYNGVGKVLVRELPKQARGTAKLQSRDDQRRSSEAPKAARPQTGYAFVLSLGSIASPLNQLGSSLEPQETNLVGSLPLMSIQYPDETWSRQQHASVHDSRLPVEYHTEQVQQTTGKAAQYLANRLGSEAKASFDYAQEPYVADIKSSDDLSI